MTDARTNERPPALRRGGVTFLVWDILDSWRGEWFGRYQLEAAVQVRRNVTVQAVGKALRQLEERGLIEADGDERFRVP